MPHVPGHNPGTGQDVVGTGGTYVPYTPPVQQLQNIVSQSESGPTTEDQAGIVTINPNVVGNVFGGVDPNTIPYSQMNEAQKVFADFYGSSTPNLFQQQLQDFITASPVNMQVYADSGLKGAGLNKFMTTFPQSLASSSLIGNVLSSIQSGAGQAKDFIGGLFPGDSTDLQNLVDDFASIPGGLKKDVSTMLGINQDLQPAVSEVREELGVKKQTANDIVETPILSSDVLEKDINKAPTVPVEIANVAAQITDPLPNQLLKELYAQDIQNAINYPNTEMAKKLRQLGLVK